MSDTQTTPEQVTQPAETSISQSIDIAALNEEIQRESSFVDLINIEMNKVIVGQKHMTERLLVGLLSDGHILLEGVPGLAKTLAINTLAKIIKVDLVVVPKIYLNSFLRYLDYRNPQIC